MVKQARAGGHQVLEPTPQAEQAYVDEVRSLARMGQRFYMECTPGYYHSEGAVAHKNGFFSDMYGARPLRFFVGLHDWRSTGRLDGLALRSDRPAATRSPLPTP